MSYRLRHFFLVSISFSLSGFSMFFYNKAASSLPGVVSLTRYECSEWILYVNPQETLIDCCWAICCCCATSFFFHPIYVWNFISCCCHEQYKALFNDNLDWSMSIPQDCSSDEKNIPHRVVALSSNAVLAMQCACLHDVHRTRLCFFGVWSPLAVQAVLQSQSFPKDHQGTCISQMLDKTLVQHPLFCKACATGIWGLGIVCSAISSF